MIKTHSMKLSEYLVKRLGEYGMSCVFTVTGGGAMHLNDSFGHCPLVTCIHNHQIIMSKPAPWLPKGMRERRAGSAWQS